ncbi:sce7725 family protein [Psychrobacter faecalis]
MYFPYLRGRQFELIAIRDLAIEGSLKNIIPIIEPVKESYNSLNLANTVFLENDVSPYLIVNPIEGEVSGDKKYFLKYINELSKSSFRCAFLYSDNAKYIHSCLEEYDLNDCMLVCLDSFTQEDELKILSENQRISHIVLLEPHRYRTLDRNIKKLNKTFIRLDDLFEKQQKNADFLKISAHKFSEEHLYYKDDHYQGFSDFTILPKDYMEGGGAPRAVVINLTYINKEADNQIWIRHFTSDTNDSIANVQGKFAEATKKAVGFCSELPLSNSGTEELQMYYKEARYPGLGTVKKITIKNHLLVIENYLEEL